VTDRGRLARLGTVAVPVVVGLALCLIQLSTRSLWIDESATVAISSQHGAALWSAMRHDGGNMLAFYALEHVLIGWFGSSELVLRLPSAIAAALSAGVVAATAARLFGRRVGLGAGVLSAVSLPLVFWGQDARAYTLLVLFTCLSYWFFVVLVDDRGLELSAGRQRLVWLGYVLSLVLAAYMSLVAVLVIPAQLLALVWHRRRLRRVLSAVALAVLAIAPLVVIAHQRGTGQLFWVPRPSISNSLPIAELLASTGAGTSFDSTATRFALLVLTGVALGVVAVIAFRRGGARPPVAGVSRARFAGLLVAAWLVVPLVLLLAESLVSQSLYQARYALISLPPVSIGLAWGCLAAGLQRRVGWAVVLVLVGLRAAQVWPTYGVDVEDWPAATRSVLAGARPGDCIAFYPGDARMAFTYYLPRVRTAAEVVPRPVFPRLGFGEVRPFVEDYTAPTAAALQADARSCRSIWFVSSHAGNSGGPPLSRQHVAEYWRIAGQLQTEFARTTKRVIPAHTAVAVWHFWGGHRTPPG
jgi:mannosyltransferase